MKKPYSKPTIVVEAFQLDQPIAAGTCDVKRADMNSLMELGYFTAERVCDIKVPGEGPIDDIWTTICYHSNVQTAFLS